MEGEETRGEVRRGFRWRREERECLARCYTITHVHAHIHTLTFYNDICSTVLNHGFTINSGCGYTCVYSCCITLDVVYLKVSAISDYHSLRIEPLVTGKLC